MHSELKRAHSLIMKVEADSEDALVHELEHVIFRIRTNQITCGTMGGYSTSNIYSYCVDPGMTHDLYFQQIDAWLQQEREAKRLERESSREDGEALSDE